MFSELPSTHRVYCRLSDTCKKSKPFSPFQTLRIFSIKSSERKDTGYGIRMYRLRLNWKKSCSISVTAHSFVYLHEMVRISSMPILLQTPHFMIYYPHVFFFFKNEGDISITSVCPSPCPLCYLLNHRTNY